MNYLNQLTMNNEQPASPDPSRLGRSEADGGQGGSTINSEAIKTLLLLLAPFAPHMTEELWQRLKGSNPLGKTSEASRLVDPDASGETGLDPDKHWSIHQHPWPQYDLKLLKEEQATIVIEVNGKVRGQLTINNQQSTIKAEIEELAKKEPKAAKYLKDKKIKRVVFVPSKLINFVTD